MINSNSAIARIFFDMAIISGISLFLMKIWRFSSSVSVFLALFLFVFFIRFSLEMIYSVINILSSKYIGRILLNNVIALIDFKKSYRNIFRKWGLIIFYTLMFNVLSILPFYFLLPHFSLLFQISHWSELVASLSFLEGDKSIGKD